MALFPEAGAAERPGQDWRRPHCCETTPSCSSFIPPKKKKARTGSRPEWSGSGDDSSPSSSRQVSPYEAPPTQASQSLGGRQESTLPFQLWRTTSAPRAFPEFECLPKCRPEPAVRARQRSPLPSVGTCHLGIKQTAKHPFLLGNFYEATERV